MNEEKMNEEEILRAIEQKKLFIRIKTFYAVILLILVVAYPIYFKMMYNVSFSLFDDYNMKCFIIVSVGLILYTRNMVEANNDIKNYRKMLTENEEIDGEQKPDQKPEEG